MVVCQAFVSILGKLICIGNFASLPYIRRNGVNLWLGCGVVLLQTIGELFRTLTEMGFTEQQIQAAVQAGHFSVPAAAEW